MIIEEKLAICVFSHLVQQVYIIPIELNSVVDVAELKFALFDTYNSYCLVHLKVE